MIEYSVRIDLQAERNKHTNMVFSSGDNNAYRLNFSFYSYGKRVDVSGYTLTVKAKRSDGQVIIDSGVIDGQNAYYIVADNMYAKEGPVVFEVALVGQEASLVTSAVVHGEVREGFGDEGLDAEEVVPLVAKMVKAAVDAETAVHVANVAINRANEAAEGASSSAEFAQGVANDLTEAEAIRVAAEMQRDENEEQRIVAETLREQAESARKQAEEDREAVFAESSQNANAAADRANEAAEGIDGKIEDRIVQESGYQDDKIMSQKAVTGTLDRVYDDMSNRMSALEGDVDSCANAVKGSASGNVVAVDDVSPALHTVIANVTKETTGAVTVTRYGKNLLDINKVVQNGSNGIMKISGNAITLSPSSYSNNLYGINLTPALVATKIIKVGTRYTLSIGSLSAHADTNWGWRIMYTDDTETWLSNLSISFTPTKTIKGIFFYVGMPFTTDETIAIGNIQVEVGNKATSFEPYIAPVTYEAPGKVVEIESLAPNMTLMTDVEDAVINMTYNKDVNKVIERLTNAIISLGGNV
ncbi:MAG: hypothetical protein E7402_01675 [Ruminococcaceae bacterium]|nr:hypothetical protein [Oscillospiraceae bacterium]